MAFGTKDIDMQYGFHGTQDGLCQSDIAQRDQGSHPAPADDQQQHGQPCKPSAPAPITSSEAEATHALVEPTTPQQNASTSSIDTINEKLPCAAEPGVQDAQLPPASRAAANDQVPQGATPPLESPAMPVAVHSDSNTEIQEESIAPTSPTPTSAAAPSTPAAPARPVTGDPTPATQQATPTTSPSPNPSAATQSAAAPEAAPTPIPDAPSQQLPAPTPDTTPSPSPPQTQLQPVTIPSFATTTTTSESSLSQPAAQSSVSIPEPTTSAPPPTIPAQHPILPPSTVPPPTSAAELYESTIAQLSQLLASAPPPQPLLTQTPQHLFVSAPMQPPQAPQPHTTMLPPATHAYLTTQPLSPADLYPLLPTTHPTPVSHLLAPPQPTAQPSSEFIPSSQPSAPLLPNPQMPSSYQPTPQPSSEYLHHLPPSPQASTDYLSRAFPPSQPSSTYLPHQPQPTSQPSATYLPSLSPTPQHSADLLPTMTPQHPTSSPSRIPVSYPQPSARPAAYPPTYPSSSPTYHTASSIPIPSSASAISQALLNPQMAPHTAPYPSYMQPATAQPPSSYPSTYPLNYLPLQDLTHHPHPHAAAVQNQTSLFPHPSNPHMPYNAPAYPPQYSAYPLHAPPLPMPPSYSTPEQILNSLQADEYLARVAGNLPLDSGHKKELWRAGWDIGVCIIEHFLRHQDPNRLHAPEVVNPAKYLTTNIKNVREALADNPEVVKMLAALRAERPDVAADLDGRTLQDLAKRLRGVDPAIVASCGRFLAMMLRRGWANGLGNPRARVQWAVNDFLHLVGCVQHLPLDSHMWSRVWAHGARPARYVILHYLKHERCPVSAGPGGWPDNSAGTIMAWHSELARNVDFYAERLERDGAVCEMLQSLWTTRRDVAECLDGRVLQVLTMMVSGYVLQCGSFLVGRLKYGWNKQWESPKDGVLLAVQEFIQMTAPGGAGGMAQGGQEGMGGGYAGGYGVGGGMVQQGYQQQQQQQQQQGMAAQQMQQQIVQAQAQMQQQMQQLVPQMEQQVQAQQQQQHVMQ